MELTITERANKGALLLDDIEKDWHNRIDLEQFDISSVFRCVLGQLYGGYGNGIGLLIEENIIESYGLKAFFFSEDHGFLPKLGESKLLNEAWFAEINNRRNK